MEGISGCDPSTFALHSVSVVEWEGFLFISLSDDPAPFNKEFAPILTRFSRFNIASLRSAGRIDYDVRANWKLLFENYSECYHCPAVIPDWSNFHRRIVVRTILRKARSLAGS